MTKPNIPEEVRQWNEKIKQNPQLTEGMGVVRLLSVPGRRTGQLRSTPVALLEYDGERWLVAGFAQADWVKNLRISRWAILTKGKRSEQVTVAEVAPEKRALILHAFAQHVPRDYFTFSVGPDASLEAFAAIAHSYPVFHIITATPVASLEGSKQALPS